MDCIASSQQLRRAADMALLLVLILKLQLRPIRAQFNRQRERRLLRRHVFGGQMVFGRRVFVRIESTDRLVDLGNRNLVFAGQRAGWLIVWSEVSRDGKVAAAIALALGRFLIGRTALRMQDDGRAVHRLILIKYRAANACRAMAAGAAAADDQYGNESSGERQKERSKQGLSAVS